MIKVFNEQKTCATLILHIFSSLFEPDPEQLGQSQVSGQTFTQTSLRQNYASGPCK